MQHFAHPLVNGHLGPAPGDEASVDSLPVQHGTMQGATCVRSFWKPSPEELAELAAGGSVMLTVLAGTHAPLRIDTTCAV